jgi:hypothetical protein
LDESIFTIEGENAVVWVERFNVIDFNHIGQPLNPTVLCILTHQNPSLFNGTRLILALTAVKIKFSLSVVNVTFIGYNG